MCTLPTRKNSPTILYTLSYCALSIVVNCRALSDLSAINTNTITPSFKKIPPLNFWNWLNAAFFQRRKRGVARGAGIQNGGALRHFHSTAVRFEIRSRSVASGRRRETVRRALNTKNGFWTYASSSDFSSVCYIILQHFSRIHLAWSTKDLNDVSFFAPANDRLKAFCVFVVVRTNFSPLFQ